MRIVIVWIVVVASCIAFAAPATTTTAPVAAEPLVGGALRYAAPDGWKLVGEKTDRIVRYKLPDESGFLEIAIDPMPGAVRRAQAQTMGLTIGKAIREQAKKDGNELLYGPRVEEDDRFFLKIRDKMKLKTGQTTDRVQAFALFGTYMGRVAITGMTDSEEKAKEIHKVGEDLLFNMKIARGVHPTVFYRTQIKIIPPVDWKEQKNDQPNGLVATYTDAKTPTSKIIVRSKVLPKEARTDNGKRDAVIAKMIDDERLTTPFNRTNPSKDEKATSDDKAIKRVQTSAVDQGKTIAVDTRYVVVGDVLLSVRALSDPADASAVDPIASKLMQSVTPNP